MVKWLITGGCGFIGRSIIARLNLEGGHSIRVFDNLSVGTREDLEAVTPYRELDSSFQWGTGVELAVGDITNLEEISRVTDGADYIIHLAANTGVGPSVENPFQDCQNNVLGTLNVLEAARSSPGSRVVFASSGAPLGVQTPPLHEEMAPRPASPYGASKLAGEGYCSAYFHCFSVETVVLRFGNVYGPRSGHKMSVVAKFIKQALAGDTLEIYGNGKQTRDFIYIDDLVDAVYRAATMAGIGGEVFQIATARETTVQEVTESLVAAMAALDLPEASIFFGEKRAGDVDRNFSDTKKAAELLSWRATTSLVEGLQKTVQSFIEK